MVCVVKRPAIALVDERRCIGCRLCVPPCPVDCIEMVPSRGPWTQTHKEAAKRRATARKTRLAGEFSLSSNSGVKDRAAVIASALARRKPR